MKNLSIAKKFALLCVVLGTLPLATIWFSGETGLSVTPEANSTATPVPNLLVEPTLPAEPYQADYGAQAFWSYCMPCHGDKGQGLTDEFRRTYPTDHQDCWKSHCHGPSPYQDGFILPTLVPRLIGIGALNKFPNAAGLHDFISKAMPFQAPGTLDDKHYWELTAFLLRQNGFWDSTSEINASNAAQIPVSLNVITPIPRVQQPQVRKVDNTNWLILVGLGLILLMLFIILILRNRAKI